VQGRQEGGDDAHGLLAAGSGIAGRDGEHVADPVEQLSTQTREGFM
jgi:hypothetical protein